jgi:hypothetical protein
MSEPTAPPPEEPPAEPPPHPPRQPARRDLLPWLGGAGFLVLAAGLIWVWWYAAHPSDATDALGRQLAALEGRVTRLEQRPQQSPPDLAPLTARVTALEQRPSAQPGAAPRAPDLAPLEARIVALEQRPVPNLAPLQARLDALDNSGRAIQGDLTRRVDAVEATAAANGKRDSRIALVQSAALSLAAGQKLGDLPGAPPALARYADMAPPTEAALRLSFPQAARAAVAVARPETEGKPLLTRLWAQTQELVTIRQGDRVVVGDPIADVLERAKLALDAGDLQAAAAAVATLNGPPAEAMAGWLTQVRALLEARAALIAWATAG